MSNYFYGGLGERYLEHQSYQARMEKLSWSFIYLNKGRHLNNGEVERFQFVNIYDNMERKTKSNEDASSYQARKETHLELLLVL